MLNKTIDTARLRTFVLLCAVIAIDKADQILLPAVYLEVCNEFGAGPAALRPLTGLPQVGHLDLQEPEGGRLDPQLPRQAPHARVGRRLYRTLHRAAPTPITVRARTLPRRDAC